MESIAKSYSSSLLKITEEILQPTDIADNIGALKEQVLQGGDDATNALEILLNLAPNPNDAGAKASAALLELYKNSTIKPSIKREIEQQSLKLYENLDQFSNNKKSAPNASKEDLYKLPASILYLAGQCAHEKNYEAEKNTINQKLHQQLYDGLEPQNTESIANMLCKGRLITAEEINIFDKKLVEETRHESSHLHPMFDLSNPKDKTIEKFKKSINNISKPVIAHINTHNHWMSAIAVPRKQGGKPILYVFDTNTKDVTNSEHLDHTRQTLGWDENYIFEEIGANMQTNTPNACGPLQLDFTKKLMEHLESHPDADVKKFIQDYIKTWDELDTNQQNFLVNGIRAELFEMWRKNKSSRDDFRSDTIPDFDASSLTEDFIDSGLED